MPFVVRQTSSSRIVRSNRVTDTDVKQLVSQYGLHPLHAERLLEVPERSTIDQYRNYCCLTLVLPWPSLHGPVTIDIRLIVGENSVIAIGDTPTHAVQQTVEGLPNDASAPLLRILDRLMVDMMKAMGDGLPSTEQAQILTVLQNLPAAVDTIGQPMTTEQLQQLALIIHRIKRHVASASSPARTPHHPQPYVLGYVAASVAVLLITLILRS